MYIYSIYIYIHIFIEIYIYIHILYTLVHPPKIKQPKKNMVLYGIDLHIFGIIQGCLFLFVVGYNIIRYNTTITQRLTRIIVESTLRTHWKFVTEPQP